MKRMEAEIKNRQPPAEQTGRQRVAAYCRVSTLAEEQELSYDSQRAYYEQRIAGDETMELAGIYGDQGFYGLHADNRPAFQRLIRDALAGKIDLILVKSISRFSRSTLDCQRYLTLLKEHKVRVFFEREGMNSDDPQCELLLKLLSAAAQEESNSISQTIKWSLEKNSASGCPTRACCYGYVKAERTPKGRHVWLVDEEPAKRIRLMFALADAGRSPREIAEALRAYEKTHGQTARWTAVNVRRRLRNEAYKGDILTGKTVKPDLLSGRYVRNTGQSPQYYIRDHHEPIVSREVFDRVQLNFEERGRMA